MSVDMQPAADEIECESAFSRLLGVSRLFVAIARICLIPAAWLAIGGLQPAAARVLVRGPSAEVLRWTPAERARRFSRMERIFTTTRIAAPRHWRLLPHGASLDLALAGAAPIKRSMATLHIRGLLVLKDGKILLERYGHGFRPRQHWDGFSVAKSMTAVLLGCAIRDGYIRSLGDRVTRYIPELAGTAYDLVTIRQLITMTSGVSWNEDYSNPNSDVARLYRTHRGELGEAAVNYLKHHPQVARPGSRFNYNSGEADLAGALVRRATGVELGAYLERKVWVPAGMEADSFWQTDQNGRDVGGCCLSASLRDYGRFGQFLLERHRTLLPADWTIFDGGRLSPRAAADYRNFWWLEKDGSVDALGIFGQMIHIDPARSLVIVMLANWPTATSDALSKARSRLVRTIAELVSRDPARREKAASFARGQSAQEMSARPGGGARHRFAREVAGRPGFRSAHTAGMLEPGTRSVAHGAVAAPFRA